MVRPSGDRECAVHRTRHGEQRVHPAAAARRSPRRWCLVRLAPASTFRSRSPRVQTIRRMVRGSTQVLSGRLHARRSRHRAIPLRSPSIVPTATSQMARSPGCPATLPLSSRTPSALTATAACAPTPVPVRRATTSSTLSYTVRAICPSKAPSRFPYCPPAGNIVTLEDADRSRDHRTDSRCISLAPWILGANAKPQFGGQLIARRSIGLRCHRDDREQEQRQVRSGSGHHWSRRAVRWRLRRWRERLHQRARARRQHRARIATDFEL